MAFAVANDVATRLGRSLTTAETSLCTQTIEAVTAQIIDEVDRTAAWAAALSPVPGVLKTLCVEKCVVAIANPNGLAAESETLGQHSHSRTFQRTSDVGVFLTENEKRLARLAVYGTLSGSSRTHATVDDVFDYADDAQINASVED